MADSKKKQAEPKIVKTDSKNGQDKCPKCGATDIELNKKNGKLRCNFCHYEFSEDKVEGLVEDISKLEGEVFTSGVQNINKDASDTVTLKCSSCGAEVVIDTTSAMQARCHWCRNYLSLNEQIPNGAVPDVLLPFEIEKSVAQEQIEAFVKKRGFFANPTFKKEFSTENIMGVYFPYMLVDVNAHALLSGSGEHQTRRYTVGSGDNEETYYDADLYHVEREFDITVKGLSVEASADKLDTTSKEKTTNIINSIMPFDTENCVKYNANYLRGYTSEKRDVNVDQIKDMVRVQAQDIVRFSVNDTLKHYDRGVVWKDEKLDVKGQQWQSAYLPVWLYSYQQVSGNKKILHYVAVNARTKETMGSIPIHMPKLIAASAIVEIIGFIAMLGIDWEYDWLLLLLGIILFLFIKGKYRNANARYTYEIETKREVSNLRSVDDFVEHRKRLSNARMRGANNRMVRGDQTKKNFLDYINSEIKDKIPK